MGFRFEILLDDYVTNILNLFLISLKFLIHNETVSEHEVISLQQNFPQNLYKILFPLESNGF